MRSPQMELKSLCMPLPVGRGPRSCSMAVMPLELETDFGAGADAGEVA